MSVLSWHKSSYCGTGEACVHVAAAARDGAVRVAGSDAPGEDHLIVSPAAWSAFLRAVKAAPGVREGGRR
ncbi:MULTISPECIES: DUF397 domain-containing protein [unclassified Streptomyces]|uniref:DUF397 domain-containing protein n=1 Tax=unclassified Streptomyces TaxID=2593676 RepID=UPI00044F1B1A|nr:DUF397 domain-containing protein [Streptomyces sp. PCS3-D2]WKV72620.1 DUF397 domain-containing protein [Streptomyces sp. PCS3-D2]